MNGMDALARIYSETIRLLDVPLGWLLWLPRDVALLLFAFGTALAMTLARKWITNQDVLRRCRADLSRLKSLLVDARHAQDKAAMQRLRGTTALVKMAQLRADLRVLVVVIVPVGLLAMWAAERFDYLPPRVGDEITLRAFYPLSSADRLTHLVPGDDFELHSPAIQVVQLDPLDKSRAFAVWRFVVRQPVDDLSLTIRHQNETATHHARVGRSTHSPARQVHANDFIQATELELRRYSFLGLGPQTDVLGLAPWLVAYLMLAIPLVPLLRRIGQVF